MNTGGTNVMRNGTENLLETVVILAGGRISFKDAQNDSVNDGESTGREDGRGSAQEMEVHVSEGRTVRKDWVSHQAQANAVHNDTEGSNLTETTSSIGQRTPERTREDGDKLPQVSGVNVSRIKAPRRAQVLHVKPVSGVDKPVQQEIHEFGNQKVRIRILVFRISFAFVCVYSGHDSCVRTKPGGAGAAWF